MKKTNIAVIPGDGIGPEVIEQGIKVLNAVAERFKHRFEYCYADMGACAIDLYGNPLPDFTIETCINADAIYFGAIGHPKYDNDPNAKVRPEQGLLKLRKTLGLYANIRPVTTYDALLDLSPLKRANIEGVDFVIYRELTGGIYFGEKGRKDKGMTAYDVCHYETYEIERIAKLGFEAAMKRRKKLTLIDKANVLESSRLWREVVQKMSKDYPEVEVDYMFVDNAAMQMILYPKQFDVIVTSNMFGDIISDEASVLAGSMGLLPSASIGAETSLFEPIHGSYPQATGKDTANPMATILSGAMLLDSLEMNEEAEVVRTAVAKVLNAGIGTSDLSPDVLYACSEIGDLIASVVLEGEAFAFRKHQISERVSTII